MQRASGDQGGPVILSRGSLPDVHQAMYMHSILSPEVAQGQRPQHLIVVVYGPGLGWCRGSHKEMAVVLLASSEHDECQVVLHHAAGIIQLDGCLELDANLLV